MGKKEFLSQLEKSLSVLQEDELRDIISEYEQHIDIKVEKGLTEEEAIADFGSLQELTGEILEAYHVRVDYASGTERGRKKPGKNTGQKSREGLETLKAMGERGSLTLRNVLKKAGVWLGDMIRWSWRQMCRPFAWIRSRTGLLFDKDAAWQNAADDEIIEKRRKTECTQKGRGNVRMTGKAIMKDSAGIIGKGCYGVSRLVKWGMEAVLWGMRLAWNGCWFIFSLFTGGFGLFSLFGLGVLAVLLIQGYPLVGITVGCAGLVCCMFSAAGLGMTLLWSKNSRKTDKEKKTQEREQKQSQESRRRVHKPERVLRAGEKESVLSGTRNETEAENREGDGQDA